MKLGLIIIIPAVLVAFFFIVSLPVAEYFPLYSSRNRLYYQALICPDAIEIVRASRTLMLSEILSCFCALSMNVAVT